jgi:DNA-binding XRE family transcriptional regulator
MPGFVSYNPWAYYQWVEKIIHSNASRIMTALLRELRERAGFKQEELAEQIGAVRQTVSAIERGERMLMTLELWIYLRPLKVTPPQFIVMLDERLTAEKAKPGETVTPDTKAILG